MIKNIFSADNSTASHSTENISITLKSKLPEYITCAVLLIILTIIYVLKFYTAITFPYVQEYRESTMIVYASEFARGNNPYALSALNKEIPTIISVYGFIPALVCAPFIAVLTPFGISALSICRCLTLIAEIAAVFMIAKSCKILTGSNIAALTGAVLTCGCCWRYLPFGGAFTDMWGLFMNALLFYLILKDEKNGKYHPAAYALILVLCFYIKQYFIYAVVGLLIYLAIRSRKEFIKLIISGAVMTVVSLIIVQLVFPLFLSEALVISQTEPFTHDKFWGLPWSIGQIPFAIRHYYLIPVLALLASGLFIFIKHKNILTSSIFSSYIFLQLAGSFPLLLYTARNRGTYLTYWFQLWFIYLIAAIVVAVNSAVNVFSENINTNKSEMPNNLITRIINNKVLVSSATFLAISVLFAYQARSIIIQYPFSDDYISSWDKTYEYLDKYGSDGKILGDGNIALYLYDNGIDTSEYGQAEYNGQTSLDNIKKSRIYSMFPYAIKLNENNIAYENKVKENLAHKEYSVVVLGTIYRYFLTDEEIENYGYKCIDRYDLPVGGLNIETTVWIPD